MTDSFCKRFVASCESNSERTAMRIVGDPSQVYSFGDMLSGVRSVAYRIGEADVEFGDRVALIGENHPAWAVAYLGTLYRGAVCVPIDPNGELETVTNFLENSEAKLAFIDADQVGRFRQMEERLGRPIPAVVWGNGVPSGNGFHKFDDWLTADVPQAFAAEPPKPAGDDRALLIYTSGTTGKPKGVPLTHANILAELDGINDVLAIDNTERILSLLPLFHAYLQIVNLWVATTYGCEVGYLKELSPAELGKAMKDFRPTILTTVPRLWYLFHKKIFDAVDAKPAPVRAAFRAMLAANRTLRNTVGANLGKAFFGQVHDSFGGDLRLAITAGSRFDEAVARDFSDLGFTILQGYGLTETSGAATATYEADNRVGSVGKPMKGAEVKLHEPDADGVGEVLIRGPIVFGGYYRNPEATAEAFTDDGWFRSGDLGRFDDDGHLYIVGRAKDVIVLPSGKNVHPEDLEVHYLKAPEVEELAIIGVADQKDARAGAEKLVAIAVPDFEYLKQAKIANSKEAIRYALDELGRELPEYQRVREYVVRTEPLPRTATRKIKRFELKKQFESGDIQATAKETRDFSFADADKEFLATPAAKTVVSIVAKTAETDEKIHPDMNLEIDLGLDSLGRAETLAAVERAFAVEFDADQAANALTVRDLIALTSDAASADADAAAIGDVALDWSKIVAESDPEMPEVKFLQRRSTAFLAFAWFVYRVFYLFCLVFMRLEVRGIEKLSKLDRPFLICPNHQSFLDAFVVCSAYPFSVFRHTFHVGAKMFFEGRIMGTIGRLLNVIPVDQDTQLMRAMKAGAAGLKAGKILNIYPEGERAYDGELHGFKKGAAILATELDLVIVPVALDGLYKVWPRGSTRIRPAKVKVTFGDPIDPKDVAGGNGSVSARERHYDRVIEHVRDTIHGMIAEQRR